MIFLTVGSMFPFDRLVRAVDALVADGSLSGEVTAQIGDGLYEPEHMSFDRFLDKPRYDLRVEAASALISHSGVGTIAMALAHGKPLLAMPRLKQWGESVNDHQIVTARKFQDLGHILVADDVSDLAAMLPSLPGFVPRRRLVRSHDLAARIGTLLETVARHGH